MHDFQHFKHLGRNMAQSDTPANVAKLGANLVDGTNHRRSKVFGFLQVDDQIDDSRRTGEIQNRLELVGNVRFAKTDRVAPWRHHQRTPLLLGQKDLVELSLRKPRHEAILWEPARVPFRSVLPKASTAVTKKEAGYGFRRRRPRLGA